MTGEYHNQATTYVNEKKRELKNNHLNRSVKWNNFHGQHDQKIQKERVSQGRAIKIYLLIVIVVALIVYAVTW